MSNFEFKNIIDRNFKLYQFYNDEQYGDDYICVKNEYIRRMCSNFMLNIVIDKVLLNAFENKESVELFFFLSRSYIKYCVYESIRICLFCDFFNFTLLILIIKYTIFII